MEINKGEILKRIMDKEDKIIVSNILDKYIKYNKTNISTYTNFLDQRRLKLVEDTLKYLKIDYNIYINNDYLEKAIIYFGEYEDFITIYQIDGKFEHKDILGTLFSLGLDYDLIGDIVVEENYAYFTSLTRLNDLIDNNFNMIKNKYIKPKKVNEMIITKDKFNNFNIIISSMRLDCIVSKLANLGRNDAVKYINDGFVLLNYKECKNIKKQVFEGDIISIRKVGKFKIRNEEKKTKKDNILLNISKYN
jgi:RNA-binding protein YlmH